jgi:hypothetical protein
VDGGSPYRAGGPPCGEAEADEDCPSPDGRIQGGADESGHAHFFHRKDTKDFPWLNIRVHSWFLQAEQRDLQFGLTNNNSVSRIGICVQSVAKKTPDTLFHRMA